MWLRLASYWLIIAIYIRTVACDTCSLTTVTWNGGGNGLAWSYPAWIGILTEPYYATSAVIPTGTSLIVAADGLAGGLDVTGGITIDTGVTLYVDDDLCGTDGGTCDAAPCLNGGTCIPIGVGQSSYGCNCTESFGDYNCQFYDCSNCTSNAASCGNYLSGVVTCNCPIGYTGDDCSTFTLCGIDTYWSQFSTSSGDWATANQWSPIAAIPTAANTAIIGGDVIVGTTTVGGLDVYGSLVITGDLTIAEEDCYDICAVNSTLCNNGATCRSLDGFGSYNCTCTAGWKGSDCSELVVCNPTCVSGTCNNVTATCECDYGYSGVACTNVTGCDISLGLTTAAKAASTSYWSTSSAWPKQAVPSYNDIVTIALASSTSVVYVATTSYAAGLVVSNGIIELDGDLIIDDTQCVECTDQVNCFHGTCLLPANTCDCDYPYTGDTCYDEMACDRPVTLASSITTGTTTTWNNATTWDSSSIPGYYDTVTIATNAIITIDSDSYVGELSITSGWIVIAEDTSLDVVAFYCTDACSHYSPCQHGGTCTSGTGLTNYTCTCATGWSGVNCTDIIACDCNGRGNCTSDSSSSSSSIICNCTSGWVGDSCQYADPCLTSNPCLHGGTCVPLSDGTTSCLCGEYWTGNTTNCTTMVCADGCFFGTCVDDGDDTASCECNSGFYGTDCLSYYRPHAPENLTAVALNETALEFSWLPANASGHNASHYAITFTYREEGYPTTLDFIASLDATSFVIVDHVYSYYLSPEPAGYDFTIALSVPGRFVVSDVAALTDVFIGEVVVNTYPIADATYTFNTSGYMLVAQQYPQTNDTLAISGSVTVSDGTIIPLTEQVWCCGVDKVYLGPFAIPITAIDGVTAVSFTLTGSPWFVPYVYPLAIPTTGAHVVTIDSSWVTNGIAIGEIAYGNITVSALPPSGEINITMTTSCSGVSIYVAVFTFAANTSTELSQIQAIEVIPGTLVGYCTINVALSGDTEAVASFLPLTASQSSFAVPITSTITVTSLSYVMHTSAVSGLSDNNDPTAPYGGQLSISFGGGLTVDASVILDITVTNPYTNGLLFWSTSLSSSDYALAASAVDGDIIVAVTCPPPAPVAIYTISVALRTPTTGDSVFYTIATPTVSQVVMGQIAVTPSDITVFRGSYTSPFISLSSWSTDELKFGMTIKDTTTSVMAVAPSMIAIPAGNTSFTFNITASFGANLGKLYIFQLNSFASTLWNTSTFAGVTIYARDPVVITPPSYIIAGLSRTFGIQVVSGSFPSDLTITMGCATCDSSYQAYTITPSSMSLLTDALYTAVISGSDVNNGSAALFQWSLSGTSYTMKFYESKPTSSYITLYGRQLIILPTFTGLPSGTTSVLSFTVPVLPHTWVLLTVNITGDPLSSVKLSSYVLNFTADDVSLTQSINITALAGFTEHTVMLTFNVSGSDASGFYVSEEARLITVAPQGFITFNPAIMPSALTYGNNVVITISLSLAVPTDGDLYLDYGLQPPSGITGVHEWSFPVGASGIVTTMIVNNVDATMNEVWYLNYTLRGASAAYYNAPTPLLMWLGTPGTVTFSTIDNVQAGSTTSVTVTLNLYPPVGPFNITLTTSATGLTFTPAMISFGTSDSGLPLTQTVVISADVTAALGTQTITTTYSGSGYINGYQSASATVVVTSPGTFTFSPSPIAAIYDIATWVTVTRSTDVTLSGGNTVALSITPLGTGVVVTPPMLIWTATSSVSQRFKLYVDTTATNLAITYTVGGTRGSVYLPPATSFVNISGPPIYSAGTTSRTATTITLGWSPPTVYVTPLSYRVTLNGSAVTLTSTTTQFTFRGLLPATTYTYSLTAISSLGSASTSGYDTVTTYPAAPSIISFTGVGTSGSVVDAWTVGSVLMIVFDRDTNQPSIGVDTLSNYFTMTPTLTGNVLVPSWDSATTLLLTCTQVGTVNPVLGTTTVTLSSTPITTASGLSLPASGTSPALGGSWGRAIAYFGVTQSVTSITEGTSGNLLPIKIAIPSILRTRSLTLTITVGGSLGTITSTNIIATSTAGGGLTATGTAYGLNRVISFATYSPPTGYSGTVAITCVLVDATTLEIADTAVLYFTMVATNSPPTIAAPSSVTLLVNTFTPVTGISISDLDYATASTTSVTSLPLKLTLLAAPGALLNFTSLPSSVIPSSLVGLPARRWELLGDAAALNASLAYLTARYPLRGASLQSRLWISVNDLGNGASSPGFAGDLAATRAITVALTCDATAPSVAPMLTVARLWASWNTMILTYSSPLAYATTASGVVSCNIVLSAVTIALLGDTPTCIWSSGTSTEVGYYTSWLTVRLGINNVIIPGVSTVTTLGGVYTCASYVASATTSSTTVTIQAPTTGTTESPLWVHIHAPQRIPRCHTNTITFTAVGGGGGWGGHVANFTWTRSSVAGVAASHTLVRYATFGIQPSLQQAVGTETWTVTMTAVVGSAYFTATGTKVITWVDDVIPLLWPATYINGHGGYVSSGTSVNYRARLEASTCAPLTTATYGTPTCLWSSLLPAHVTIDSTTAVNSMITKVSPGFAVGNNQVSGSFQLNCSYGDITWSDVTYSITWDSRLSSAPVAVITGGNNQTVWTGTSFTLSGASSYIRDGRHTIIQYQWTCGTTSSVATGGDSCRTVTGALLSLADGSTVTIDTSTLLATEAYFFTLTVIADDGRQSSATTTVTVLPAPSPYVSPPAVTITPSLLRPVSNSPLSLTAMISPEPSNAYALTYLWRISGGSLLTTPTLTNQILTMNPAMVDNFFTPGVTYTFEVSVTNPTLATTATVATSIATWSITIPPLPRAPLLIASVTSGVATLLAVGVDNETVSWPTTIRFYVTNPKTGITTAIDSNNASPFGYMSPVPLTYAASGNQLNFSVHVANDDISTAYAVGTASVVYIPTVITNSGALATSFLSGLAATTLLPDQQLTTISNVVSQADTLTTSVTANLLTILTNATQALTTIVANVNTSSIDISTVTATFNVLTSSTTLMTTITPALYTSLYNLLLAFANINWNDRTAVTQFLTAIVNLFKAAIVSYSGVISRRLLASGSTELAQVDQLYTLMSSTVTALESQLSGDGDYRSYEQDGCTAYVTKQPLPWIVTNTSTTTTLSFNYISSDSGGATVPMTATFTGFPAATATRLAATATLQSTYVSVFVISPNPYRIFGTTIGASQIVGPAVALKSYASPSGGVGTPLVATAYPYTVWIPFNRTLCSRSQACRPTCIRWNNATGEWFTTGLTSSPTLDETLYRVQCSVSTNTPQTGPITVMRYIVPTPNVTSATAIISSVSVVFTWDADTNMGGRSLGVAYSCSGTFSTATIASFSGIPSCKWLTASTLQLTGFGNVVMVGMSITIAAGAVSSADGFAFTNSAQTVTVVLGTGQTSPTVVARLDGADQLSQCDTANFTAISSTGNGGHAFVGYVWTSSVTPTSGSLTSSWIYFVFAGTDTTTTSVVITVTITNWLGQTASVTKTVPRALNAIPTISLLEGNYLSSQRSLSVTSTSIGAVSACASNSGTTLTYKWTQISNGAPVVTLSAANAGAAQLVIPSYTLVPNTTYQFTSTVTQVATGLSNSVVLTVSVIPSTPPTLLYAQFTRSAARLRMYFDLDTNGAGMLQPLNKSCARVLDQATLELLRGTTAASCTWTNASTLTVSMGADYTAVDGSMIGIAANTIRSSDGYSAYSAAQSVTLLAPSDVTPIAANVIGDTSLSSCSGLTLTGTNSTGKGGKPSSFVYVWTLISPTDLPSLNASVIAQSSSKSLTLTATVLPANRTYVFGLYVSNWRNGSASTTWTVVKEGVPVLQLAIVNGINRYTTPAVNELAQVNPDLTSACGLVSSYIIYSWEQTDGPEIPDEALYGTSAKIFTVPSHYMVAGETYSFSSSVTIARVVEGIASNLTNSITLTMIVTASPLVADITGGNRLVSLATDDDRVTVSAEESYDPDVDDISDRDLMYQWSCLTADTLQDCFNVTDAEIDTSSMIISLTPSQVALANGESLIFTVMVYKADGRTASDSVTIATSITFVPGVEITTLASTTKFNPDTVLRLIGSVTPAMSDLTYEWSCSSGNLDMTDTTNFASGITSSSLAVAASALDGGATYVFVLTATDSLGRVGVASITITTNAPPTIGTCTSSLSTGSVNTTVTLSCSEWTDDIEDLPLSYAWYIDSNAGLVEVGYFSTDESIDAYLPPGEADYDYELVIVVVIRDIWESSTSVAFTILVPPPEDLTVSTTTTPFLEQLSISEQAGDVNRFAQTLLSITALLDASRSAMDTNITSSDLDERAQVRYQALTSLVQQAADGDENGDVSTSRIQQQVQLAYLLCQQTDELNPDVRVNAIQFVQERANSAFTTDWIDFTETMGDSMLRTVDQVSYSITTTLANAIANATSYVDVATADTYNITTLKVENAAVAKSFLASLSLISRGEVRDHVVGENAVIHETDRVYVSTARRSNTSLSDATVGLTSDDQPGFVMPTNLSSTLYDYSSVDISFFIMNQHVFAFADIGTTTVGQSRLVGLTLYGTRDSDEDYGTLSSAISVDDLPDDSRILIYVPHDNSSSLIQVCRFWNETSKNYSTDGCYLYSSNETVAVCSCSHLTVFNINLVPTITDPTEALLNFNWDNLSKHPAGIITVGCIWALYFFLWYFAFRRDQRLNNKALADFHAAHQRRGTRYYTGLIPDGDHELHGSSTARFRYMFSKNLAMKHLWYSTWMRTADAGFSSRERLTQCITMLIVSLALNAVFYGVDRDIGEDLVIMAYCCLVNIPLSIYLRRMFGLDPTHNNAWGFLEVHVRRAELTAAGIKWTPGKEHIAWIELEQREMNAMESAWGGMPGQGLKRAASVHPAAAATRAAQPKGCCARLGRFCNKLFCSCRCFKWDSGKKLQLLGYHHRYIALPPFETIMTAYQARSWREKLPPRRKLYAYLVAWFMMLVGSFVVLLFALQFDLHSPDYVYTKFGGAFSNTWPISGRWLFSTLLASIISVCFQQPFTILAQTFIMACICYRVMYKPRDRRRTEAEERAIELPSGMMINGEPTQRRVQEELHEVKRLEERNFIDQGFNKVVVPDYNIDPNAPPVSATGAATASSAGGPIVVAGTSPAGTTGANTVIANYGGASGQMTITVLPSANQVTSPHQVDAADADGDDDAAIAARLLNQSLGVPSSPASPPVRNAPDAAEGTITVTVDAATPMIQSPMGSPNPMAPSPSVPSSTGSGSVRFSQIDPKLLLAGHNGGDSSSPQGGLSPLPSSTTSGGSSSSNNSFRATATTPGSVTSESKEQKEVIVQSPGAPAIDHDTIVAHEDTADSLVDHGDEHIASSFLTRLSARHASNASSSSTPSSPIPGVPDDNGTDSLRARPPSATTARRRQKSSQSQSSSTKASK